MLLIVVSAQLKIKNIIYINYIVDFRLFFIVFILFIITIKLFSTKNYIAVFLCRYKSIIIFDEIRVRI